jgi:hypothetical protein
MGSTCIEVVRSPRDARRAICFDEHRVRCRAGQLVDPLRAKRAPAGGWIDLLAGGDTILACETPVVGLAMP